MFELPALLNFLPTSPGHTSAVPRDDIDSLHHHDVWRLGRPGGTAGGGDFSVQFRGRDRGEVSGIGDRDRYALSCERVSARMHTSEASSRFKNRIAPSRHSGLSSLSPNEPRSSDTSMSASSGTARLRISP